jgi:putative transposase
VRDLAVLFLHLLATVARLAGPGGARAVVAESVLARHQLLILNRSRKRSPISVLLIASSPVCVRSSSARAG